MKKVVTFRFPAAWSTVILSTAVTGIGLSLPTQPAFSQAHHRLSRAHAASYMWPVRGKVMMGFTSYHEGIDIAAPEGTPVVAAASGEVLKAGWSDFGLGYRIVLKHGDGSTTVYGHNRRLLVHQGQQVEQGQAIAEIGNTGNSMQPHVHFEIHPDGMNPVNPIPLLP